MPKTKNFIRVKIVDAGADGRGDVTVGDPVNKYFNKTFEEAGYVIGDKMSVTVLDSGTESYELAQWTQIGEKTFKRTKLIEQRKRGVPVDNPTTPLALSELAQAYHMVTAEESQEQLIQTLIAAETDANTTAESAALAAQALSQVEANKTAIETALSQSTTLVNDFKATKQSAQNTLASLQAQEDAVVATIGGGWGAITHKLKDSNSIKAVCLCNLSTDTDYGLSRSRDGSQSWYRETLNTAWRGSRRPRPVIAPIVEDASKLSIYDGGISTPELWMDFLEGNGFWFSSDTLPTCVAMRDGLVYAGKDNALFSFDFIKDESRIWSSGFSGYRSTTMASRNGTGVAVSDGSAYLVDSYINAVAVTVLQTAEIDESRGLPFQTVAVATEAGASIINPTGTKADKDKVVDITFDTNSECAHVSFDEHGVLFVSQRHSASGDIYIHALDIPSADVQLSNAYDCIANGSGGINGSFLKVPTGTSEYRSSVIGGHLAITNKGLVYLDLDTSDLPTSLPNSLHAYMTSDYFTGIMTGDTIQCLLADTVAETVSDTDLATDGGFDVPGEWNTTDNWQVSGGTLNTSAPLTVASNTIQYDVFEVGKTYEITFDLVVNASNFVVRAGSGAQSQDISQSGTHTVILTATGTADLWLRGTAGFDGSVDNLSIREAITDRSGKENHAQIVGSLTKTKVATGAELVWFDFSAGYTSCANVLGDIATDDFAFMWWHRSSGLGGARTIFSIADYSAGFVGAAIIGTYDPLGGGKTRFRISDDALATVDDVTTTDGTENDGIPHLYVCGRQGSNIVMMKDGVVVATTPISNAAGSLSNPNATFQIGVRQDGAQQLVGSDEVTQFRVLKNFPSADAMARAYAFERSMFEPGGTASLGVTEAITCIDYDWSNGRAYVGTAGGGTVVIDTKTMQRLEIISSAGYPDFTSDNVVAVSAAQGGWVIGTAAEAVFYDPPIAIRERG